MNAVETLEAAITKLEELRSESTGSSWHGHQNILGIVRVRTDDLIIADVFGGEDNGDDEASVNAELIVTSHRMVKPVLAILRAVAESIPIELENEPSMTDADIFEGWDFEFAIARAILGDS